jgi:TonB family protein
MRELINYIIEANAALLLFLLLYRLILRNETDFRFSRWYVLGALLMSMAFPLLHLNNSAQTAIPTLGQIIPENWLPVVDVGAEDATLKKTVNTSYSTWQVLVWCYFAGVVVFTCWLLMQLGYVWIMMQKAVWYTRGTFRIIESADDKPTFSFFNLIYIGRAPEWTAAEKEQMILHEQVHARQLHSLDKLLITLVGIVFWFNPFIKSYKKILIELHEFEADARAVENSDVNRYCSLLARVALQSHFPIASHFNESLTLKRIEMMRTIKTKVKNWKFAAFAFAIVLSFVAIACQDQIMDDVNHLKENSSMVLDVPEEVQRKFEFIKKSVPGTEVLLLETTKEGASTAEVLQEKMNQRKASMPGEQSEIMMEVQVVTDKASGRSFLIVQVQKALKEESVQYTVPDGGKVFLVVEHQPEFPGGFDAMRSFIRENLKYPQAAAAEKREGVVYISFIVNEDGSIADPKVLKGIEASMDNEALRVVKMFPKWKPGEQNGLKVRTRFVMPIKYNL